VPTLDSTAIAALLISALLVSWLLARRRAVPGIASLLAVVAGLAAFSSLPHRGMTPSTVNYLGYIPVVWFLGLAIWLIASRSRVVPAPARPA